MELDDEFDDLLAEISEPTSPKQLKLEPENTQPPPPGSSKETVTKPASSKTHCVLVNNKQKGNPVLKFIRCVPWEFDDIIPDYEVGKTICLLFLSIKYHNMNPDYITNRLKELGKKYDLRVLLVQVDLKDPHIPLKNLTRICLLTDMTLMLAWSPEEAGKIIENYKVYENKPPDKIMEKIENDPHQKIVNALTSIKPVNKTDAMTLITTFGTLENIIKAKESRLAECPGFGATKAKKLYKALHEPFLKRGQIKQKSEDFEGDISLEDVANIENDLQNQDNKMRNEDQNQEIHIQNAKQENDAQSKNVFSAELGQESADLRENVSSNSAELGERD